MDAESRRGKASDEPPSKNRQHKNSASGVTRKRVSQACDRCRARKDKCDGLRPVCSTCAALEQTCSYDPATKKRGLPEGYVRAVEKLWGLTIREADGVEDTILTILNGGPDGKGVDDLVRTWNDREGSETLLETWRKSRISHELKRLIPILDSTEEKPGKRKRPETGPLRAESTTNGLQQTGTNSKHSEEPSFWNQNETSSVFNDFKRNQTAVPPVVTLSTLEYPSKPVELPSTAWQLLDVFFSYTHCWLPIMEKHDLLRTAYQYAPGGLDINNPILGSADHAALWAVLAYAEHQQAAVKGSGAITDNRWTCGSMYTHARNLIPGEDGPFALGHVQALVVLALLSMGRDQWDRAWLLIGQAARISILLGLDVGQESQLQQKSHTDRHTRKKHIFLGCFAIDTIIAARLNRRPQLCKQDADRVGSVEEDGPDEWNHWTDSLSVRRSSEGLRGPTAVLSTFNQLILLVKILNRFTNDMPSGTARPDFQAGLIRELDSCRQSLPAFGELISQAPLLPHQFHLRLMLLAVTAAVQGDANALRKEAHIFNGTVARRLGTSAAQTLSLLGRQLEELGLLIIPPTYEYITRIAVETSTKLQDNAAGVPAIQSDWQSNMEKLIMQMEKAWPAFHPFRLPLASSLPELTSPSPLLAPPGSSSGMSFDLSPRRPTHPRQSSLNANIFEFNGNLAQSPGKSTAFSGSPATFPQPEYNSIINFPAANMNPGVGNIASWMDQNTGQIALPDQASVEQMKFLDGSLGSDIDGDSMFNDFATLDTMEWNNNWDESLMNLGFENPDQMTQDFYAVCGIADPLYSNALVQQLVSSNSSTMVGNTGLQQVTGNGNLPDASLQPLQYDSHHLEASHILQGFSTAQTSGHEFR